MFQNRRQAALGNINLGSLSAVPTPQDLSFLMEQGMKYRGRFVEITWSVPKTGSNFQLTVKFVMNQREPDWMLYRSSGGGGSELVWGHTSNDLTLMHNLVMLECDKPAASTNTISANAMDAYANAHMSSGAAAALAPSAGTGSSAHASAAGAHGDQPAVMPAGNPSNQWLQNLNYIQSGTARGAEALAPPQAAVQAGASHAPAQAPAHAAAALATAPGAAAGEELDSGSDLLLEGSLTNITVPKLLRYLTNNRLTGRLSLQSSFSAAEIFLKNGTVTHAATLEYKGEHAVLDAATWGDGEFHFSPDDVTAPQTIDLPTADVIAACDHVLELSRYIQQAQVWPGSFLLPAKQVNRGQFEQIVGHGTPTGLHQLWRMYESIDGNRTLSDVLRKCPMSRPEWLPAVAALLRTGLITISERPAIARPGMFLEGAPFDQAAVDVFVKRTSNPADGVFYREPFMFMLQQEQYRYERSGARYALALFTFATSNMLDGNVVPFGAEMMAEACARIIKAKRKLDIIGRFDDQDYALLLPDTDSAGAAVFANRLAELMKKPAIGRQSADNVLVASFGIASVPDDVRDLSTLIAAAKAAKSRSKMMGAAVCIYGEN
jgi:diguanylate cyclase (GGDEF)-like protein